MTPNMPWTKLKSKTSGEVAWSSKGVLSPLLLDNSFATTIATYILYSMHTLLAYHFLLFQFNRDSVIKSQRTSNFTSFMVFSRFFPIIFFYPALPQFRSNWFVGVKFLILCYQESVCSGLHFHMLILQVYLLFCALTWWIKLRKLRRWQVTTGGGLTSNLKKGEKKQFLHDPRW